MLSKINLGIISLFSLTLCAACADFKTPLQRASVLEGNIYHLSGNQMPGPGRARSKGRGVSRELFIYTPVTASNTIGQMPMFTKIKGQLVARAQSDSTGHYRINMPAGSYSVFIKESNGFFGAEADGQGHLNPVTLTAGQTTRKDFTITLNAVF